MNIYGIDLENLEKYLEGIGEKKFHAKQIFRWLYDKKINSFDEITDLKKDVINKLKSDFNMNMIKIVRVEKSEDTSLYKYGLYISTIVGSIKGIDRSIIIKKFEE